MPVHFITVFTTKALTTITLILSKCFILVRVVVDSHPILEMLCMRWEHTLDGMLSHSMQQMCELSPSLVQKKISFIWTGKLQ